MLKALQLPVFIILMIVVVFLSWVVGYRVGGEVVLELTSAKPIKQHKPISARCKKEIKIRGFCWEGLHYQDKELDTKQ